MAILKDYEYGMDKPRSRETLLCYFDKNCNRHYRRLLARRQRLKNSSPDQFVIPPEPIKNSEQAPAAKKQAASVKKL